MEIRERTVVCFPENKLGIVKEVRGEEQIILITSSGQESRKKSTLIPIWDLPEGVNLELTMHEIMKEFYPEIVCALWMHLFPLTT